MHFRFSKDGLVIKILSELYKRGLIFVVHEYVANNLNKASNFEGAKVESDPYVFPKDVLAKDILGVILL